MGTVQLRVAGEWVRSGHGQLTTVHIFESSLTVSDRSGSYQGRQRASALATLWARPSGSFRRPLPSQCGCPYAGVERSNINSHGNRRHLGSPAIRLGSTDARQLDSPARLNRASAAASAYPANALPATALAMEPGVEDGLRVKFAKIAAPTILQSSRCRNDPPLRLSRNLIEQRTNHAPHARHHRAGHS